MSNESIKRRESSLSVASYKPPNSDDYENGDWRKDNDSVKTLRGESPVSIKYTRNGDADSLKSADSGRPPSKNENELESRPNSKSSTQSHDSKNQNNLRLNSRDNSVASLEINAIASLPDNENVQTDIEDHHSHSDKVSRSSSVKSQESRPGSTDSKVVSRPLSASSKKSLESNKVENEGSLHEEVSLDGGSMKSLSEKQRSSSVNEEVVSPEHIDEIDHESASIKSNAPSSLLRNDSNISKASSRVDSAQESHTNVENSSSRPQSPQGDSKHSSRPPSSQGGSKHSSRPPSSQGGSKHSSRPPSSQGGSKHSSRPTSNTSLAEYHRPDSVISKQSLKDTTSNGSRPMSSKSNVSIQSKHSTKSSNSVIGEVDADENDLVDESNDVNEELIDQQAEGAPHSDMETNDNDPEINTDIHEGEEKAEEVEEPLIEESKAIELGSEKDDKEEDDDDIGSVHSEKVSGDATTGVTDTGPQSTTQEQDDEMALGNTNEKEGEEFPSPEEERNEMEETEVENLERDNLDLEEDEEEHEIIPSLEHSLSIPDEDKAEYTVSAPESRRNSLAEESNTFKPHLSLAEKMVPAKSLVYKKVHRGKTPYYLKNIRSTIHQTFTSNLNYDKICLPKLRNDSKGDNDSGVDESTQNSGISSSPKKNLSGGANKSTFSPNGSPLKNRSGRTTLKPLSHAPRFARSKSVPKPLSSFSFSQQQTPEPIKKVSMNKIKVGMTSSPNLKQIHSKIGSLEKAHHRPGGGNFKVESRKLDWNSSSKTNAYNKGYVPSGGEKKIEVQKLEWKAQSRIRSLDNAAHRPGGGSKKIQVHKVEWNANSKVGSNDNVKHRPGGGNVKIINQKLDINVKQGKVGSLENVKHKPGGGEKKVFNDVEYLKQMSEHSNMSSRVHSNTNSRRRESISSNRSSEDSGPTRQMTNSSVYVLPEKKPLYKPHSYQSQVARKMSPMSSGF
nr:microtubule-associated protein 4-like isoform X4 [Lepeophtheirus salmonis]XP_040569206.1 microtubule-associated protein 4-like isoform X4 [Lepeophtheirus salmonis]